MLIRKKTIQFGKEFGNVDKQKLMSPTICFSLGSKELNSSIGVRADTKKHPYEYFTVAFGSELSEYFVNQLCDSV